MRNIKNTTSQYSYLIFISFITYFLIAFATPVASEQEKIDPAADTRREAAAAPGRMGSLRAEAEPEFRMYNDRLITGSVAFADERGGTYSRQSPITSAEQGYAEPQIGQLEQRQQIWQAEQERLIEVPSINSIAVAGETGGTYSRQSPIESAAQGYAAPNIERFVARQRTAQERQVELPAEVPERAQWRFGKAGPRSN